MASDSIYHEIGSILLQLLSELFLNLLQLINNPLHLKTSLLVSITVTEKYRKVTWLSHGCLRFWLYVAKVAQLFWVQDCTEHFVYLPSLLVLVRVPSYVSVK